MKKWTGRLNLATGKLGKVLHAASPGIQERLKHSMTECFSTLKHQDFPQGRPPQHLRRVLLQVPCEQVGNSWKMNDLVEAFRNQQGAMALQAGRTNAESITKCCRNGSF